MITIILLDYLRHDHTEMVKRVNLNNAGHPFELVTIDRNGISAAINEGIHQAQGAVVTMANDILMPDNWLYDMVRYAQRIHNSGMVGIHTVESQTNYNHELGIWECCPFGNVLITKEAIDKVGYFNLDLDPYSTNDADYYYRCFLAGLRSYYIPGKCEHLGHDVGEHTEYRKMKDEGLSNGKGKQWLEYYKTTGNIYLGYDQQPISNE